jgi:UMP-CMP kinase
MSRIPTVVFVLGGPGSGKGTQCELISKAFNYVHLSAGELLRRESKNNPESETAKIMSHIALNGGIVPSRITTNLMISEMKKVEEFKVSGISKFLIDGYPRNQENLDTWIAATSVLGNEVDLKFVLNLECDEQTCTDRIIKRMADSGRADDKLEVLAKRFETHTNVTLPILEHFHKQNLLKSVNANLDVDQVFKKVRELFLEDKL